MFGALFNIVMNFMLIPLIGVYGAAMHRECDHEGCGGILTDMEIKCLPIGAKVMTYECGMRFLTDYLSGDTYFKIAYPEHNLDRARTQLKLVADMEAKWDQMEKIVEKYL